MRTNRMIFRALAVSALAAFVGCDRPKARIQSRGSAEPVKPVVEVDEPREIAKKFIAFGWEMQGDLTPEKLRANQPALAKTGLSGIGIYLPKYVSAANPSNRLTSVMSDPFRWETADFRGTEAAYREVLALPGLKHSFLKTFFHHPTNRLAWADDAIWSRIAHNLRVTARFAKESGFKGLCVDHEDYKRARQFTLAADDGDYAATTALVRRRAQELFRGVFEEFPDAALLFYWFLTQDRAYYSTPDALMLAEMKRDLWPSFANGILDVLPPTVKIVDGNEEAYLYESVKKDFLRSSVEQRDRILGLVAPENRAKYRAQIRVGYGLYMDMYVNKPNPKDARYYYGPVNGSRLCHFDRNATAAAYAASEYIWLWGERGKWVDWKPDAPAWLKKECIWPERLYGLPDVLEAITDPEAYADRRAAELHAEKRFANLVWNGTCDPHVKNLPVGFTGDERGKSLPAPFYFWFDGNFRHGKAGIDIGGGENGGNALRVEGVGSGCVMYHVPDNLKQEGDMFVFEVSVKGKATIRLGSRTQRVGGDPSKWRVFRGLIRIGEGNPNTGVNFNVAQEAGETTWFDNVKMVRVFRYRRDGEELLKGAPPLPEAKPADGPARKKIIGHSWDLSEYDPEIIAKHISLFDNCGLNGICINTYVDVGNKKIVRTSDIQDATVELTREMLAPKVVTFRRISRSKTLTDNLLNVFHAPKKRYAWTDDAAWARLAHNMRILAWAAKMGGLKGFMMDQEDYPGSKQYFLQSGDPDYDQTKRLVRKRAAQVFKGVFEEFPEAKILSFWFLTQDFDMMTPGDPRSLLRTKGELWPAFINGMLDVMPPEARLIEGDECAYQYQDKDNDFFRRGYAHRGLVSLVEPENRDKFRAQMLSGFGLYLDMYVRGEPIPRKDWDDPHRRQFVLPSEKGSFQRAFARNLNAALTAADEYIWTFACHEKTGTGSYVPWKNTGNPRWDGKSWIGQSLDGFSDICRALTDSENWRRERLAKLRQENRVVNLVKADRRQSNRDLAAKTPSDIDVISVGPVTAGDFYSVEATVEGNVEALVRWYDGKKGGRPMTVDNIPLVLDGKDPTKPRKAYAFVRIPEGVTSLDLCMRAVKSDIPARYSDLEIVNIFDFKDLKPAVDRLGPPKPKKPAVAKK